MTNIDNSVMDWNDVIEDDGQEYVLLLKRIITSLLLILKKEDSLVVQKFLLQIKKQNQFKFFSEMGVASMKFDLILSKALTWKLSAFFRSIGQKKRGEKITMDWNKVLGAKGRAHIKQKVYTNQSDEEKNINDLDYFIDYDEKSFSEVVNDKDIPF